MVKPRIYHFPQLMKAKAIDFKTLPLPLQNLIEQFGRSAEALENTQESDTGPYERILTRCDAAISAQLYARINEENEPESNMENSLVEIPAQKTPEDSPTDPDLDIDKLKLMAMKAKAIKMKQQNKH